MIALLKDKFSNNTIGAPFLMAQILTMPEYGYVKEPFKVISYGMPVQYGGIKPFEGLNKNTIINTIWIGLAADYMKKGEFVYPIHPTDRIIKEFIRGDNKITLFMGGLAIDQKRTLIEKMKLLQQYQQKKK